MADILILSDREDDPYPDGSALEAAGHRVGYARLGERLGAGPTPDVCFVDATKDLARGRECCRALKALAPRLPIVVAIAGDTLDALGPDWQVDSFVVEGCAPEELLARTRMIIGAEFNRQHLFIGNYMQIGAVLFHRSLVEEGARFDERIGCYEDWDFVIQLAQLTHFVYTARPTNYWCAYAGESGAGLGANKRDEATRPFHDMVVAKWAERARMVQGN